MFLMPAQIATLCGTFLLVFVFVYLFSRYRQSYLATWSMAWALLWLRTAFDLTLFSDSPVLLLLLGHQLATLGNALLLLRGTQNFTCGKMSRWWYTTALLLTAWITAAALSGIPFFQLAIPVMLFAGVTYVVTGIAFMRGFPGNLGARITGITFMLWGLQIADFPFIVPYQQLAWTWYGLTFVFASLVTFGVVIVYFEKTRIDLANSESRFRRLAENAPDVIFRLELVPQQRLSYISPAVTSLTGYHPDEFQADPELFRKFIHPDDIGTLERIATTDEPAAEPSALRLVARTGELVWCELHTARLYDRNGKAIALEGIARDITRRKNALQEKDHLQQQLLESQKMEAIGKLAGGIAHDFNNILTVIQGYTDLLLGSLAVDDPRREDCQGIRLATERAAALPRQLLAYSRKQTLQRRVINLNHLVNSMDQLLQRLIGEKYSVTINLTPQKNNILADAGQIQQVLMNLALNARDAMPDGGPIIVQTGVEYKLPDNIDQADDMIPREYAFLLVKDAGTGIAADIRDHIFDPFFSTKPTNKGAGLGLSVVYGIVKQHEGWIEVDSQPNQGTTLKIHLPLAPSTLEPSEPATDNQPAVGPANGAKGKHILVVEDEDTVRDICQRILQKEGYAVTAVRSAEEALLQFQQTPATFDLVFTDIILPGRTGLQLAADLARLKPEIPILLTSGYSDENAHWDAVSQYDFQLINKPYSLTELLQAVHDVFAAAT